ncbi:MAG: site-specific DNA-methyltransferase [Candidatus Heimdallarchaeota archaeon]|nr:MAG: site-specific DNA-methyltransferase [Candidatus Heimdallarchaeota archaeon]
MTLSINKVYNKDCLEGLDQLDSESVDLLLTDPPFGIDFDKVGSQYNRKQKDLGQIYTEVKEDYYNFTLQWLQAAWLAMKPTASGFIFSGWNQLFNILNALSTVGFRLVNHIIWKYQFGVFTKKRFVTSHYHILYFTKLPEKDDKLRTFNRISEYSSSPGKLYFEDVWRIKRDYQKGGEKTPTRLPLAVTDKCVRIGSNEGDLVLEPFMGSGSVILSCIKYNRRYIGFEISEKIFSVAQNRIQMIKQQLNEKGDNLERWLANKR